MKSTVLRGHVFVTSVVSSYYLFYWAWIRGGHWTDWVNLYNWDGFLLLFKLDSVSISGPRAGVPFFHLSVEYGFWNKKLYIYITSMVRNDIHLAFCFLLAVTIHPLCVHYVASWWIMGLGVSAVNKASAQYLTSCDMQSDKRHRLISNLGPQLFFLFLCLPKRCPLVWSCFHKCLQKKKMLLKMLLNGVGQTVPFFRLSMNFHYF